MSEEHDHTKLEYYPLTLFNTIPNCFRARKAVLEQYELRNHVGRSKNKHVRLRDDLKLPDDSLLAYGREMKPKLLICITMYNEPFKQLLESLAGCYRAYYELVNIDESFKDRCHIVIIADGYDKLDEDFLMKCELAGFYNEFKTKKYRTVETSAGSEKPKHVFKDLCFINKETMNDYIRVYGTNNLVHCFSRMIRFPQFMNSMTLDEQHNFSINKYYINDFLCGSDKAGCVKDLVFSHLAMPIHFAIKHRNQGKIESHKWFFKGFCEYMNPRYCQIIDCGSIPLWNSISHIIMHMETIPEVGGACGEIECIVESKKPDGTEIQFMESVFLRAQYVEYKLSHYLDKATETIFGFVSVLPGAFSTFRWECVKGAPLAAFLKGSKDEFGDLTKIMSCVDANKYLAEDRIMCLEIIAQKGRNDIIHYIPGAKCLTDPPLSLTQLIKQRRRWFNGSLFASLYVLQHMCRIWRRSDSCIRNIYFMLLYLYMIIQMLLSFVIVGLFYGVFSIFLRATFQSSPCTFGTGIANYIEFIYLAFLFLVLLISTMVEITWVETSYRVCSFFMGIWSFFMVANSIFYVLDASVESLGVLFLFIYLLSFALPLLVNVTHLRVCDFIKGCIYCVYLSPTYVNLITIYAISNIHDVSWGSRETTESATFKNTERKREMMYKNFRAYFLIFWTVVNLLVGYFLQYLYISGDTRLILYLGGFLTSVMAFRIIISLIHRVKAHFDVYKVQRVIDSRTSTVFADLKKNQDQLKMSDVFSVYYDSDDDDMKMKQSNRKIDLIGVRNPNEQTETFDTPITSKVENVHNPNYTRRRSSINDDKIFRGFNYNQIKEVHELAQGRKDTTPTNRTREIARNSKGFGYYAPKPEFNNDSASDESVSDSEHEFFGTKRRTSGVWKPSFLKGAEKRNDAPAPAPLIRNKLSTKLSQVVPLSTPDLVNRKVSKIMEEERKYPALDGAVRRVGDRKPTSKLSCLTEYDMEESVMSDSNSHPTDNPIMSTSRINFKESLFHSGSVDYTPPTQLAVPSSFRDKKGSYNGPETNRDLKSSFNRKIDDGLDALSDY